MYYFVCFILFFANNKFYTTTKTGRKTLQKYNLIELHYFAKTKISHTSFVHIWDIHIERKQTIKNVFFSSVASSLDDFFSTIFMQLAWGKKLKEKNKISCILRKSVQLVDYVIM